MQLEGRNVGGEEEEGQGVRQSQADAESVGGHGYAAGMEARADSKAHREAATEAAGADASVTSADGTVATAGAEASHSPLPLGAGVASDALLLLSSQAGNARVVTALLRVRDGAGGIIGGGVIKWGIHLFCDC